MRNWRNAEDMLPMPHTGGTISLAKSPGTLVRFTFHKVVRSLREWESPGYGRKGKWSSVPKAAMRGYNR